jgi:predicted nucleic acid-binding protein
MAAEPVVIIDAGPLLALINRRDHYHHWATQRVATLSAPFITSESVLSETCFLLHRENIDVQSLFKFLQDQVLLVPFDLQNEYDEIAKLMTKYVNLPKGQKMSLADASLVRLAELHNRAAVFTLDHHFTIYRKNGRQKIPLISPSPDN